MCSRSCSYSVSRFRFSRCGAAVAPAALLASLLFLSLLLTSSTAIAQTTSTWSGGAGNWAPCPGSGGNALWDTCSTNVYPDGDFKAVIQGGPVTLGPTNGISVDSLTLAGGDALFITPGYLDITAPASSTTARSASGPETV